MFEFLNYTFPVSGVTTNVFIPPIVALVVSFFTSMGGVSGAFLLLPFQISFLHFTSPSGKRKLTLYSILWLSPAAFTASSRRAAWHGP